MARKCCRRFRGTEESNNNTFTCRIGTSKLSSGDIPQCQSGFIHSGDLLYHRVKAREKDPSSMHSRVRFLTVDVVVHCEPSPTACCCVLAYVMRTLSFLARPLTLLSSTLTPTTTSRSHPLLLLPRRTFAFASVGLAAWSSSTALFHDSACAATADMNYLNATAAAALDAELMTQPGFTLEQLMELAGLSVAQAVYTVVEQERKSDINKPNILVICGPGNNGGDGLVAARHLVHFGYDCTIVYPKRSAKQPHYANLVQQCTDLGIEIRDDMPSSLSPYTAFVDAMFGFSFTGAPREPFASIIQQLVEVQDTTTIVAVDVPSGWHVNDGDAQKTGFAPAVLVSLTAPKQCARHFTGKHHFCGGRFLPPALADKYDVRMPPYPGFSQVMELPRGGGGGGWEDE